jgi:hypothetical protein
MKYSFLEIGTSDFNTLIEQSLDNEKGIAVEPILEYLDKLPNKKNVIKLNYAVGAENCKDTVEIFFIPEETILAKNLPNWLKGCNSIEKMHPQHVKLGLTDLVSKKIIKQISIIELFKDYQIYPLDHLKIDTEGLDCDLLLSLSKFLKDLTVENHPKRITFEVNSLTDKEKLSTVLDCYKNLGYIQHRIGKQDLELVKEII